MNRNTLRSIVILALLSIFGIGVIQVYWFQQAFDMEEEQWDREIRVALHAVARQFFDMNQAAIPSTNPIQRLSTNYYVVMINNEIDANLLEVLLKTEFEKREIKSDFEYGIYDCVSDEMVYGSYISFGNEVITDPSNLPKWENQSYYFGVIFPSRNAELLNRLDIWVFSSVVLLLVAVFFGYSLFIIFKQKRLSEVQKDFINNMTHEFKTPISTIAISSKVLQDPEIVNNPDRLRNYAGIIETENARMKNQVDRVLQIAKTDNEIPVNLEPVELNKIILEVIEGLKPQLQERNTEIYFEPQDAIYCKADPLHLSNVLFNLFDNSMKYTLGVPQIVIKLELEPKKCIFRISDNGPGIDKKNQKRIFQKFFRVNTGNIHNVKGFGLGLSYVQQIMKSMGGNVSIEKSSDVGTTFKLEFKRHLQ